MAFQELWKVAVMENAANNYFHCRQDRTWGKRFKDDVEEAP